ncbi:MAG: RdgB/HAM1 family non-canonical purine NTP pyrophosphatase [Acidobacteriota bacterium]
MKLLVATRNKGKFGEIARLLALTGLELISLQETALFGEAPESGETHLENAASKALFWSRQYEGPVLAEDSGLEVEGLDGKPGVHTARYGGPGLSDEQRYRKLLAELKAKPGASRAASYRCVCALANGGNLLASFSGSCRGEIATAARGSGGFGYDPVFLYPPLGKTFAEISAEEKDRVSHRGEALRALVAHVEAYGLNA